jgi:hypothetical protein
VAVNSITSGQGSAPNSVQLLSPTGVLTARFVWQTGQPALGTYVCVRLIAGAPMSGFDGVIGPGQAEYVPQAIAALDSCGPVTAYAADGARMHITLSVGGAATMYALEYQFAGDRGPQAPVPQDIGDRLAARTPQLLLITGRQFPSEAGAPSAINLHDYNVARVTTCVPLSSVSPQPAGFTLPLGCAYIGGPLVGSDLTHWSFDCGWASRDARGTLAPALTQQGWASCGAVTATAIWAKGTARLVIAEGAGGTGGYPKLSMQARASASTACP